MNNNMNNNTNNTNLKRYDPKFYIQFLYSQLEDSAQSDNRIQVKNYFDTLDDKLKSSMGLHIQQHIWYSDLPIYSTDSSSEQQKTVKPLKQWELCDYQQLAQIIQSNKDKYQQEIYNKIINHDHVMLEDIDRFSKREVILPNNYFTSRDLNPRLVGFKNCVIRKQENSNKLQIVEKSLVAIYDNGLMKLLSTNPDDCFSSEKYIIEIDDNFVRHIDMKRINDDISKTLMPADINQLPSSLTDSYLITQYINAITFFKENYPSKFKYIMNKYSTNEFITLYKELKYEETVNFLKSDSNLSKSTITQGLNDIGIVIKKNQTADQIIILFIACYKRIYKNSFLKRLEKRMNEKIIIRQQCATSQYMFKIDIDKINKQNFQYHVATRSYWDFVDQNIQVHNLVNLLYLYCFYNINKISKKNGYLINIDECEAKEKIIKLVYDYMKKNNRKENSIKYLRQEFLNDKKNIILEMLLKSSISTYTNKKISKNEKNM